MSARWMSHLRSLECTACGREFDAGAAHGVCPACGKVLFARYDLAELSNALVPDDFRSRSWDMWRYRELLPVCDEANVVTLGEGMTPLLRVTDRVSAALGFHGRAHRGDDRGQQQASNPHPPPKAGAHAAAQQP